MMDEQDFRLIISVMQLHCGKRNLSSKLNLQGIPSMWIMSCLTDWSAPIQRDLVLSSLTLTKQTRRMTQYAEILTQTS